MIPYKQLSLADIFTDCQNKFDNDKYEFLELLENTINLDEIVPASFVFHFHAATGRPRRHLLYPMLKAVPHALLTPLHISQLSLSASASAPFRPCPAGLPHFSLKQGPASFGFPTLQ